MSVEDGTCRCLRVTGLSVEDGTCRCLRVTGLSVEDGTCRCLRVTGLSRNDSGCRQMKQGQKEIGHVKLIDEASLRASVAVSTGIEG